jgi:hypothetical protein
MLIQDLHVRVINAATSELTIDRARNTGPQPKTPRTR